jgi:hypothetical protein
LPCWLFAVLAVSPQWLFRRDGCLVAMAVTPRWLFGRNGCYATMAVSL